MCCSQQSAAIWQLADIIYLPPGQPPRRHTNTVRRVGGCPRQQYFAWAVCSSVCAAAGEHHGRKMWVLVEAKSELLPDSAEGTQHNNSALFSYECGSATKHIRYGFKALQVMCCLLTFILCSYHSLSVGENDNALGFKALRQAQHLRVLTFLVLIGWICVLRVTTEIGITTLETKTSLTGKSLKRLLPGMHITPGNWFCPPSF